MRRQLMWSLKISSSSESEAPPRAPHAFVRGALSSPVEKEYDGAVPDEYRRRISL